MYTIHATTLLKQSRNLNIFGYCTFTFLVHCLDHNKVGFGGAYKDEKGVWKNHRMTQNHTEWHRIFLT